MRTLTKNLLLFALLFVAVLTASAQSRQRIGLTVTPASQYSTVDECNHYSNTLTLSQPSQNKLLADVLREGNNYLVFHRTNDKDNSDVQFARINLINIPGLPTEIGSVDFSTYTVQSQSTSSGTLNYIQLTSPWGGYVAKYAYGFYTFTDSYITYTIPAGVSNSKITVSIHTADTGTDSEGYFLINDQEVYHVDANTVNDFVLNGTYSTGDQISIIGCDASGAITVSPDMVTTGKAVVISIDSSAHTITPCLQRWDGNAWGAYTLMASAQQASAGTEVNLSALGSIVDEFTASTALNDHPNSYGYQVTYNSAATEVVDDPNTPVLTANPTTLSINGENTQTASFNVSGSRLVGDVTVTGDANFTVNRASITPTNGTVNNVSVTVIAASGLTTETTGIITLTTPGVQSVTVNVTYTPPAPSNIKIGEIDFATATSFTSPWSSSYASIYNDGTARITNRNGYIYFAIPTEYRSEDLTLVIVPDDSGSYGTGTIRVNSTAQSLVTGETKYIQLQPTYANNRISIQPGQNSSNTPYIKKIEVWTGSYTGN